MTKKITIKHPDFTEKIPKIIEVLSNTKKIILTNTIDESEISLRKNSSLIFVSILNKGWKGTKKITFKCDEENAKIIFLTIIIAEKEESFDFETTSFHNAKNTKAEYFVRGIMSDKAQVKYKGVLEITKKGENTEGHLSHHSLMLSNKSKVTTIPSLKINANEVKAGHSATIGKPDKETIFYLNSRGVDKKTAENILTQGFLEKDLKKIRDKKIQQAIIQAINDSKK
jgi:Fe-S cluster assembly protein SufD